MSLSLEQDDEEVGSGFIDSIRVENEHSQTVLNKNSEDTDPEVQIFMPSRTLPRTPPPQPFTIPPCEEVQVGSKQIYKML